MSIPATEDRIRAIVAASGGRWSEGDAYRLCGMFDAQSYGDACSIIGALYGLEASASVTELPACDECGDTGSVAATSGDGSEYAAPCPAKCPASRAES